MRQVGWAGPRPTEVLPMSFIENFIFLTAADITDITWAIESLLKITFMKLKTENIF